MPVHVASFPIRYYECDAYNHVNHANYVRLMGEAAFSASAVVGYSARELDEIGHVWLAREHEIEFIRPFYFGDTVSIHTWVADFRRVRSQRRYDFYVGDELAARASTDWVFLNKETGRPVTVPHELVSAYTRLNGGDGRESFPRTRYPEAPPPPPGVYRYRMNVEWRDVDPQQHVNNAAYLSYLENGTWALLQENNWSVKKMVANQFGIVARRYRIEYREPAVMGDELEVSTWVSDAKRATAVRHYTIHRVRDGALLVRARALWVWVNPETGAPRRIPENFKKDLESNFAANS